MQKVNTKLRILFATCLLICFGQLICAQTRADMTVRQVEMSLETTSFLQDIADEYPHVLDLSISGIVAFPLEDFAEQNKSIAFGLGGQILFPLEDGDSPAVSVGLEGNYMIYGSDSDDLIDTNGFEYELTTNNNIINGYLVSRFRPRWQGAIVYPYLDALVGGRYLYTRTQEEEDGETIDSYTEHSDFSFAWGGAGGVEIWIADAGRINFRASYTRGSRSSYLNKNGIYPDPVLPDEWVYDVKTSRTDMLGIELGFIFLLR